MRNQYRKIDYFPFQLFLSSCAWRVPFLCVICYSILLNWLNKRPYRLSAFLIAKSVHKHPDAYSRKYGTRSALCPNCTKVYMQHVFSLVFLFSFCLENALTVWSLSKTNLAVAVISNNEQTKFIQQSLKKGGNHHIVDQYDHTVIYEKYAIRFPDLVVVLIMRVF